MKIYTGILILFSVSMYCQTLETNKDNKSFPTNRSISFLEFNKDYKHLELTAEKDIVYYLNIKNKGIYQFGLNQEGIAIYYTLKDPQGNIVFESNFPEDFYGLEKFEHTAKINGRFTLTIQRFDDARNTSAGKVSLYVKSLNKKEMKIRERIKKELEVENSKTITTIDIDHFWEAYDLLKNCESTNDSINVIQSKYLDRATNGMIDFIQVRDLTAEKYVQAISEHSEFYNMIRSNTYVTKKAEPIVEEVLEEFEKLYDNFRPFKVCFAIGINNSGGTVSSEFVLIGSEITTSVGLVSNPSEEDIIENIKGIVAHEIVHTQQPPLQKTESIECLLLYQSIKEGAADFIAELISKKSRSSQYGEEHEESLWLAFKNELCNQNIGNWLYNGDTVIDKPRDLGYYMGYEIVKTYYNNSNNKKEAVIEIISMDDPIQFLVKSRYDEKFK